MTLRLSVFNRLLLLVLFSLWPIFSQANETILPRQAGLQAESAVEFVPVVVNGNVLFKVSGIRAYSAERRANEIEARINSVAENPAYTPEQIHSVDQEDRAAIFAGDTQLMSVFDIDAEREGIRNRMVVAETYALLISEGVQSYRYDRTPAMIKKNIMLALVRTVLLVVVLVFVIWLFRHIDKYIEKVFKRRIRKLEAKSMRIVQSEQIWRIVSALFKIAKALLVLAVIYFFLTMVLDLFPWTRYLSSSLLHMVLNPLAVMGHSIISYLPSLFFLVVLFLVTRYLLKLLQGFFDAIYRENLRFQSFDSEWAWPTYRIARVVVIIFAVVIAYPYIPGSDSAAFKGISLFLGVLFSLGSTSFISNIIAGYAMTYRRAFRIGDMVRIGETTGTVTDIRLMVTNLLSLKNENIVIPNSTILNCEVVNYSTLAKDKGLILHTLVGIGYEVPWRQVEVMLIEAATRTNGLEKSPEPFVLQKELTDFAVIYEINAYTIHEERIGRLYSELHANIQDVFNENNVQIMTPNYVADTPEPKVVPPSQWFKPPASEPEAR